MRTGTHIRCLVAREAAKMSQSDAAKLLNVSVRTIQRVEKKGFPGDSMVEDLGRIYNCSAIWLQFGLGPMERDARLSGIVKMWPALDDNQRNQMWQFFIKMMEGSKHVENSNLALDDSNFIT